MIDLDIGKETDSMINLLLENRIKQLEKQVAEMLDQKMKDDLSKAELEKHISSLKSKPPNEALSSSWKDSSTS